MAWDPNSSAWDWDTQGITVLSRTDTGKSALNSWLNDTEACSSKQDGAVNYTSRDIGSLGVRISDLSHDLSPDPASHGSLLHTNVVVTPLMANLHGAVVSNGEIEHTNIDPLGQGRLSIVTNCVGSGDPMYSCGTGGLESVVQTSLKKKQEASLPTNFLDFGSSQKQLTFGQHKQSIDVITVTKDDLAPTKHHTSNMIESYDDRIPVADEQQGGMAHGGSAGSGDSLTGLQLGKRIYTPDVATSSAARAIPKSLSTSKKSRAGAAISQIPRCQVEGCKLDLTTAKDYHRRHKVCEPHSKAVKVVVASREQRFCQQCSRFHVLTEFDESKRSCRRRLEGHNKRRRKPQPDPLELQARLQCTLEDWSFLQQPRYPRLPVWQDFGDLRLNGLWSRRTTQCEDQPMYSYSLDPSASDTYVKGLPLSLTHNKYPLLLLQSPKTRMPIDQSRDNRLHQYLPGLLGGGYAGNGLSLASSLSSSSTGAGVFTGLNTTPVTEVTRVVDSGRALSLLSLQLQCSQAPDMVSLNLSSLENVSTIGYDQHVQEEPQQFLLHGRQQQLHDHDYFTPNMPLPSPAGLHQSHVAATDKELFDCSSLVDDAPRQNGSYPVSVDLGGRDTKQTRDLMQLSSFKMTSPRHESVVFPVGNNGLEGSQFSFTRY